MQERLTNVSHKSVSAQPTEICDVGMLIAERTNTWLERRSSKEYTSKILCRYIVSSDSTNIFYLMLCENVQKIPPKLQWCRMYRTSNLFHYIKNNMRTLMQTYAVMTEAYGEQTLARSTIFNWHQQFTQGRASASPKPKSGRPVAASTKTTVNTISTMLAEDDSLSQWQIYSPVFCKLPWKRLFSLFSFLQFL